MNQMELREHALERAEFFWNLMNNEPRHPDVWETTMYEWLFVWATGARL